MLLPIFYLSPAFWQNPHMDFNKVYISIYCNYLARPASHKLKITYYNVTLTYETWLEWQYVATSMISGGSRSFAKGEGQLLFQSRKFKKWVWSVLFMENQVRVQPQAPPWILHLCHCHWSRKCGFHCMILMGILWWILQINVSFTIFHNTKEKKIWFMLSKSVNKYLLLAPSSNKHKIIVYLLPK